MEHFLNILWNVRWGLLFGLGITALVSLISIVLGTMIGVVAGIVSTYGSLPLRFLVRIYSDTLRGVPVLVLVLAAFYIPSVLHVNLTAIEAGVLALTIFCGAHISEIVRGALQAIPKGQIDAAKAIGLTFRQRFFYVLLPQALRQIIPTWTNAAVEIVKATTLLSIIGVPELIMDTQQIIGRTFLSLPFYFLAGVLYFAINFSLERLGRYVDNFIPS